MDKKRKSLTASIRASYDSLHSLHVNKRRLRWWIRGVMIAVAIALCAYQCYIVSVLYFGYPTNVDIQLDRSRVVSLPSVTICSELASTILVDELAIISPLINTIFGGKTRTEVSLLLGRARSTCFNSLSCFCFCLPRHWRDFYHTPRGL